MGTLIAGDDPKSRTAELAQTLLDEIQRRRLGRGDFLGTEAQISQAHGVSRTIVREAVSRLRTLGILTSVQSKGLVVGSSDPVAAFARTLPVFGRSSDAGLAQLAQLGMVIEIGAIDTAVDQRTDEQAQRLKEIAEELAAADAIDDFPAQSRLDAQYHSLLLEMTGNPLVTGMSLVLAEFFQKDLNLKKPRPRGGDPLTVWEHRVMAQAMADRDRDLLRVLLRKHLANRYRGALRTMAAVAPAEPPSFRRAALPGAAPTQAALRNRNGR